jgi:hypothetical protein
MSTLEIKRTNNTAISVNTSAATGSRITVDHVLWFARELQKAVDAGMPMDTEVKIRNESGVNGVSISARAVLVQDIP